MSIISKIRGLNKKIVRIILIIVGVLVAIASLAGIGLKLYEMYQISQGTYSAYDEVVSVERSDGSAVTYVPYDGNILKYSRDGVTAITETGEFLWTGAYEMKDPVIDTCESYVAIGDRGSKSVYIFNENGYVSDITVEYPILMVRVANQGVVAVLMEGDECNYVNMYKETGGEPIVEKKFSVESTGYALSIALSNDAIKLVVSCMNISNRDFHTNVAYYNFGDVGANETDYCVAGNVYEKDIVAKVVFLNNSTVCIYKNQGFEMYSMTEKPDEKPIVAVDFENEIISTFSTGSYVGFVLNSEKEDEKYRIVAYNTKGNKILDEKLNFEYKKLVAHGSNIILYNNTECLILTTGGKVRFQGTFDNPMEYVFGGSNDRYFVIYNDKIEVIKLKGA